MAILTRWCACGLSLACLLGPFEIARAGTFLPRAHVVWVKGNHVYIASPDSLALEPGMILTFRDRDKAVAGGEVTAVYQRELIAAKLTSGSLAKVKHLDRLTITAVRPVIRGPSLLRVGYPAPGRKNLLFDCASQSLDAGFLRGAYRAETTGGQSYRLVRDSTSSWAAAAWPETLLVRLYDEVSDEEIALERGDLDAAVFWPGEASTHIREATSWEGQPSGLRAVGIYASISLNAKYDFDPVVLRADEREALERLNQDVFRGDLQLLLKEAAASQDSSSARFEVDASFPGRDSMERFLNRAIASATTSTTPRVVHLTRSPDSNGILADPPRTYLFGVRCPIISAPSLRPYLDALGIDPLANLFQCLPAAGEQ